MQEAPPLSGCPLKPIEKLWSPCQQAEFAPSGSIVQGMSTRQSATKGVLLALFCAGAGSLIGTLMHQTRLAGEVPIGLLFSLAMVVMLAANIRDQQQGKLPGLTFAVAMGLLLFAITQNLTDDILIPANDLGLWWSYGGIGLATLIALWPKLRR